MADNYNIYKNCHLCDGTGQFGTYDAAGNPTGETITCPSCGGEGKKFWGRCLSEKKNN